MLNSAKKHTTDRLSNGNRSRKRNRIRTIRKTTVLHAQKKRLMFVAGTRLCFSAQTTPRSKAANRSMAAGMALRLPMAVPPRSFVGLGEEVLFLELIRRKIRTQSRRESPRLSMRQPHRRGIHQRGAIGAGAELNAENEGFHVPFGGNGHVDP